jgi:predicted kinase
MDKELIVLIGMPGSGKSTYYRKFHSDAVRISQDDQGKEGHFQAFCDAIDLGKEKILIDRCNFNRSQRKKYVGPARAAGYKITMVIFQTSYEECISRIQSRQDHPNLHADLDEMKIRDIVAFFRDAMKEPTEDEYDDLVYV